MYNWYDFPAKLACFLRRRFLLSHFEFNGKNRAHLLSRNTQESKSFSWNSWKGSVTNRGAPETVPIWCAQAASLLRYTSCAMNFIFLEASTLKNVQRKIPQRRKALNEHRMRVACSTSYERRVRGSNLGQKTDATCAKHDESKA